MKHKLTFKNLELIRLLSCLNTTTLLIINNFSSLFSPFGASFTVFYFIAVFDLVLLGILLISIFLSKLLTLYRKKMLLRAIIVVSCRHSIVSATPTTITLLRSVGGPPAKLDEFKLPMDFPSVEKLAGWN